MPAVLINNALDNQCCLVSLALRVQVVVVAKRPIGFLDATPWVSGGVDHKGDVAVEIIGSMRRHGSIPFHRWTARVSPSFFDACTPVCRP
jgi:hypothetical protein